jgi:hypothetical protein
MFPTLFQFENGLRLAINKHLSTCYGSDWWENSLKTNLPEVYQYAEDFRENQEGIDAMDRSFRSHARSSHSSCDIGLPRRDSEEV